MIKHLAWLLMVFLLPVQGFAGAPPPAEETRQPPARKLRQDSFAPRILMEPLPEKNSQLFAILDKQIRKRMQQAGFILSHPPPKDYLVGSLEKRNLIGLYDLVLLKMQPIPPGRQLIIHRPGPLLIDPLTKEKMGVLSFYIGAVESRSNAPSGTVAQIIDSPRAVAAGDLLLEMAAADRQFKIHQTPAADMEGRLLRIENDLAMAGSGQLFAVGLGRRDRATLGLWLPIYKAKEQIKDPVSKKMVDLPSQLIGHGVLIRVGEKASLAFLVDSIRPIQPGDRMATAP